MDQYLEMVDHDPPSESSPFDLDSVTRAVRVYAHLDQDGRWWEPPRTHHILTGPAASDNPEGIGIPSERSEPRGSVPSSSLRSVNSVSCLPSDEPPTFLIVTSRN